MSGQQPPSSTERREILAQAYARLIEIARRKQAQPAAEEAAAQTKQNASEASHTPLAS